MPIETKIWCDYCPTVKQETNHFWRLRIKGQRVEVEPLYLPEFGDGDKIACGQECVIKAVSQHMDVIKEKYHEPEGSI
jgi:hypothetical protein